MAPYQPFFSTFHLCSNSCSQSTSSRPYKSLIQLVLVHTSPTFSGHPNKLIAIDLSNDKLWGLLLLFLALMPSFSALSFKNIKFMGNGYEAVVPGSGISQFTWILLGFESIFDPLMGQLGFEREWLWIRSWSLPFSCWQLFFPLHFFLYIFSHALSD